MTEADTHLADGTRLIGHLRLPVSARLDASCLGAASPTEIGGFTCEVHLPGVVQAGAYEPPFVTEGTEHLAGMPCLTPPAPDGVETEHLWEMRRWWDSAARPKDPFADYQPGAWGGVHFSGIVGTIEELDKATITVDEVVIDFGFQSLTEATWTALEGPPASYELPDRSVADPVLDGISEGLNAWWDSFSAWIRVLATQSLAAEHEWVDIRVEADGLHLHALTAEASGPCGRRNIHSVTVSDPRVEKISLAQWELALRLAGDQVPISAELALISDARLAYIEGAHRLAVIHAGTVIEIMLRQLMEEAMHGLDASMAKRILGEHRSLGRLVELLSDQCGSSAASLKEVVTLRNAAVHRNASLSADEALFVIEVALDVGERALGITREGGTSRIADVPTS